MPQSTDGKIAESNQDLSGANKPKKSEDSTEPSKKHTTGESANNTMEASRMALIDMLDHMTRQIRQAQQELNRDLGNLTASEPITQNKKIPQTHKTCGLVERTKAMVIACQNHERLVNMATGVICLSLIVDFGQKVWGEQKGTEDQQEALAGQREAKERQE